VPTAPQVCGLGRGRQRASTEARGTPQATQSTCQPVSPRRWRASCSGKGWWKHVLPSV